MVEHLKEDSGTEPLCFMTGGAGWKMAPSMSTDIELVESLIFEGLLVIAHFRQLAASIAL
jgi:type III pantothenate kinase